MNPLGASTTIEVAGGGTLTNAFDTIAVNDIDSIIASNSISPHQVLSGISRGTQRINDASGSYITVGVIPDSNGKFGISFFKADGTEWLRAGVQPDGTDNLVIMKDGYAVKDAFS